MSRIAGISTETAPDELKEYFETVSGMLGRVPNSSRILAHAPYLSMLFLPFAVCNQREWPGVRLSGKIKELVIIKTSHINDCEYCFAHNTALGEAAGITHEQLIEMSTSDYLTSELFDDREKAAIEWAEHMTRNTAGSRDDVYNRLTDQFSDGEIVELTLICGMFNMVNRINDSLQVTLEGQPEIDKIRSTLRIDPLKTKNYLRWLADSWPEDFDDLNERVSAAAQDQKS